jgi:hypothetical protein
MHLCVVSMRTHTVHSSCNSSLLHLEQRIHTRIRRYGKACNLQCQLVPHAVLRVLARPRCLNQRRPLMACRHRSCVQQAHCVSRCHDVADLPRLMHGLLRATRPGGALPWDGAHACQSAVRTLVKVPWDGAHACQSAVGWCARVSECQHFHLSECEEYK